jgi:hypothetical protein
MTGHLLWTPGLLDLGASILIVEDGVIYFWGLYNFLVELWSCRFVDARIHSPVTSDGGYAGTRMVETERAIPANRWANHVVTVFFHRQSEKDTQKNKQKTKQKTKTNRVVTALNIKCVKECPVHNYSFRQRRLAARHPLPFLNAFVSPSPMVSWFASCRPC